MLNFLHFFFCSNQHRNPSPTHPHQRLRVSAARPADTQARDPSLTSPGPSPDPPHLFAACRPHPPSSQPHPYASAPASPSINSAASRHPDTEPGVASPILFAATSRPRHSAPTTCTPEAFISYAHACVDESCMRVI